MLTASHCLPCQQRKSWPPLQCHLIPPAHRVSSTHTHTHGWYMGPVGPCFVSRTCSREAFYSMKAVLPLKLVSYFCVRVCTDRPAEPCWYCLRSLDSEYRPETPKQVSTFVINTLFHWDRPRRICWEVVFSENLCEFSKKYTVQNKCTIELMWSKAAWLYRQFLFLYVWFYYPVEKEGMLLVSLYLLSWCFYPKQRAFNHVGITQ